MENRYAEVIDLAIEVGTLLVVLNQSDRADSNILEPGLDVQAILDLSESQILRHTESCAMILGILPIVFHIAELAIRQPELARSQAIDLAVNPKSTGYRLIVLPYLFNYWKTALEKVMFRFNNPQQVTYMLHQVQNLPIEEQGQSILSIIQHSLMMYC